VIELIAQCLSEEALVPRSFPRYGQARSTLARLNRVSKAVHEVTLAALYETTEYFDELAFSRSVKLEDPKGWKFTKYVIPL
jgi:hypothetical protein